MRKVVRTSTALVIGLGIVMSVVFTLLRTALVSIYASDPEVVAWGAERLLITTPIYFTCGLMNMMAGVNRGMGYSLLPTTVSLLGACAFRLVWIWTVFAATPTFFMLFISYPITWTITAIAHYVSYFVIRKRAVAKNEAMFAAA